MFAAAGTVYPGSGCRAGKVAVITDTDSGIGRTVAAPYAREGADVAILYLLKDQDARDIQKIVEAEERCAITIKADVGAKKMCDRAAAKVVDALGGLDLLVNHAGKQHPDKDIRDITKEQLQGTFQRNIFGMFDLVQAALPHLQSGSTIINGASVTMDQGAKKLLDYRAPRVRSRPSPQWWEDRHG